MNSILRTLTLLMLVVPKVVQSHYMPKPYCCCYHFLCTTTPIIIIIIIIATIFTVATTTHGRMQPCKDRLHHILVHLLKGWQLSSHAMHPPS
jgi:hypothetical protein